MIFAITTGVIIGVYHNTPGIQKTREEVKNLSTLNATELIYKATTDGTNQPSLGGIIGTNPPSLGGFNGTNRPSLGGINGTNPPSLGGINGTNPPSLGGINGTTPPSLGTTDGSTPPSLGITDGTNLPTNKKTICEKDTVTGRLSCAANELIAIDDAFYGRRENGPRCGCTLNSCDTCQDEQDAR
ncbi:hypothetical protein Bbelb_309930 [Branchiostoma belcheri]|nr:hypothetical protein Bbelb_309930 [Branchiostoma belcheri]